MVGFWQEKVVGKPAEIPGKDGGWGSERPS